MNMTSPRTETKGLLLFLTIVFVLPILLYLPPFFLSLDGTNEAVLSLFSGSPAAGAMAALLFLRRGDPRLPRTFFWCFLGLTAATALWGLAGLFLPERWYAGGCAFLLAALFFVILFFCLSMSKERRAAANLSGGNWALSARLLLLFLVLLLVRAVASNLVVSGNPLATFAPLSPAVLLTPLLAFVPTFTSCFSEEYGWRTYFQPTLQSRLGPIKGVLLFGVLWAWWHMPAPLFTAGFSLELVPSFLIVCLNCISFGTFLAFAYAKTHNLWLAILIHFCNNSLSFLLPSSEQSWAAVAGTTLIQMALFLPFLLSPVFRQPLAPTGPQAPAERA